MNGMEVSQFEAGLTGREQVILVIEKQGNSLQRIQFRGIGGPDLLNLLEDWRTKSFSAVTAIEIPSQTDTASLLLKEAILKAQGLWIYPYTETELCHCRAVSTLRVDEAILTGAHSPTAVSVVTSASTACGTCKKDVESILNFRLGR